MKNFLCFLLLIPSISFALNWDLSCEKYTEGSDNSLTLHCLADKTGDKKYCEQIEGGIGDSALSKPEAQYRCMASSQKDPSYCDKVAELRLNYKPLQKWHSADPGYFKSSENDARLECKAEATGNKRYCEVIEDKSSKSTCMAIATRDPIYCDAISDVNARKMCNWKIPNKKPGD